MNTQFIKGLSIDWNRIAPYSYLREIEALHDLKNLEFTSPITFLWGRMAVESLLCWKPLP